jgi:hypothetical protein
MTIQGIQENLLLAMGIWISRESRSLIQRLLHESLIERASASLQAVDGAFAELFLDSHSNRSRV